MYWMPKFKNMSPWKIPNPPPDDALELAKLAIHRITSVDLRTTIDVYHVSGRMMWLLLLRVREAFGCRRRPHSGPIEL